MLFLYNYYAIVNRTDCRGKDTDLHQADAFGIGFRRSAIVAGRKAPCSADEIAQLYSSICRVSPPGYGLSWVVQKPFIKQQAGPNGSA